MLDGFGGASPHLLRGGCENMFYFKNIIVNMAIMNSNFYPDILQKSDLPSSQTTENFYVGKL